MIDAANTRPWPEEIRLTVTRFKQGDLVERPPFFFAANPRYGVWDLSRVALDQGFDGPLLEMDPADGPPYGIITTQTCDLDEQAFNPKQPWLQVSPVYAFDSLGVDQRLQVEQQRIQHLVRVTAPLLPPDSFWIADLRIELPLEKSWLVGRAPIEGFISEQEYLQFAHRLARRRLRPALANVLSQHIVGTLRRHIDKTSRGRRRTLVAHIYGLRLQITGARLAPTAARLVVITHEVPSEDLIAWLDEWWDTANEQAARDGLSLLGNRYTSLDKLTAREYITAIELDFAYLSPDE